MRLPITAKPGKGQSIRSLLTKNIPFILREPGSGTRTVLEDAIAARGLQAIHPFLELGSTEAIKKAVIARLGVSFVSEHTIGLELAAGLIKRVAIPDFKLIRPSISSIQNRNVYLKQHKHLLTW